MNKKLLSWEVSFQPLNESWVWLPFWIPRSSPLKNEPLNQKKKKAFEDIAFRVLFETAKNENAILAVKLQSFIIAGLMATNSFLPFNWSMCAHQIIIPFLRFTARNRKAVQNCHAVRGQQKIDHLHMHSLWLKVVKSCDFPLMKSEKTVVLNKTHFFCLPPPPPPVSLPMIGAWRLAIKALLAGFFLDSPWLRREPWPYLSAHGKMGAVLAGSGCWATAVAVVTAAAATTCTSSGGASWWCLSWWTAASSSSLSCSSSSSSGSCFFSKLSRKPMRLNPAALSTPRARSRHARMYMRHRPVTPTVKMVTWKRCDETGQERKNMFGLPTDREIMKSLKAFTRGKKLYLCF